ncbi:diguanylate cyclase (GGDEF) domain-containing protein [Lachnospiraceae bacterium]|nr:diguanylate cyclase (GGDEF) domain-containing protein [Lachnospiraceae bacterium]
MKQLEANMRRRVLRTIFIFTWLFAAIDIGFYIVDIFTGFRGVDRVMYPLVRILLPFIINAGAWFGTMQVVRSEKCSGHLKNLIVCGCLMTICGTMVVFHSSFTLLWVVPSIVLLLASVFHDTIIQRDLFFYNLLIIFITVIEAVFENPEKVLIIAENATVVLLLCLFIFSAASLMQQYNDELARLNKEIYRRQADYREKFRMDFLTGVYSKAYFFEKAAEIMDNAADRHPIVVGIIDLDHFKRVNDTYGHENGDLVLEALGTLLREYQTETLCIGRFGGEEFVMVFDEESLMQGWLIMDEIRTRFAEEKFTFTPSRMTLSGGVAVFTEPVQIEEAIAKADQALYQSKTMGRNRITRVENETIGA